jgi:uncharacterized protein (TIGR00730 family)
MICVYCGSSDGENPSFRQAATAMTAALARRGAGIVYGGGTRGLMGAVAAAAIEAGVPLRGVVPNRFRSDRSVPPRGAEYSFVDTMQERKAMMRELSAGFIALPGGIGTIDEVAETLMLRSLGFHAKPLALLNVGGFFEGLYQVLRDTVAAGFMKPSLLESIIISSDPEALAESLLAAVAEEAKAQSPAGS